VCDRTIKGLNEVGDLTNEEAELLRSQQRQLKTLPSGRWLWVGGTEWIKDPKNFYGAFNCSSTTVDSLDAFGLMMNLAMQGCGTGAVLEQKYIGQLPPITTRIEIGKIAPVGGIPRGLRAETTTLEHVEGDRWALTVGDSREGWVEAYQSLFAIATNTSVSAVVLDIDLGNVRPSGEKLKGFGGTSNPIRLPALFGRCADILNGAIGRQLTGEECCLLIDESALVVVAGNVRRSSGMRQFDKDAPLLKTNLWQQLPDGKWAIDPKRDALRMANHTRVYHTKPSREECIDAVSSQFHSGEGAIQYAPEAERRAQAKDRYGLNPCFVPGTMVMTREGHFPIESLVGKTVEIHDGDRWVEIDNFRVTATEQPVYNVRLYSGEVVTATPYHTFILKNGDRVALKDLQPGMELMSSAVSVSGTVEAKGAYLKGFLIGDGTHTGEVTSCRVYEPKHVCVDRLVASQQEIGVRRFVHASNGTLVGDRFGLSDAGYLLNLNSALQESMLPWVTVYRHEFPVEVYNWTDHCKTEFIAGLFDADGGVTDSQNGFGYQLTSVSEPFLQGVIILLRGLGVRSKITPVRKGGLRDWGDRGGVCYSQDSYRLFIAQAGSIKFSSLVHFERLRSFSDRIVKNVKKDKPNFITGIDFSHIAPAVYCCTVPKTHSFALSNSLLVGNCGEIHGKNFLCNLSEIHLNMLHPLDLDGQKKAFEAGAIAVAALLHYQFPDQRYKESRAEDPIVGVSFTGLFDFFVNLFGVDWLRWWEAGRPTEWRSRKSDKAEDVLYYLSGLFGIDFEEDDESINVAKMYLDVEEAYLKMWRTTAHLKVWDYCDRHDLKRPNRCTTAQPAGSKSLLTGASPGWHPPKAQRFIRRITMGAYDPVAIACTDYGYTIIPSQEDKDENGKLLDDPFDPRVKTWLVEIPTEVEWADLPGADAIDISKFSALAQFDFYMQVQKHYTTHNTSATIELRENEIEALGDRIYQAIQDDEGYISAALLARFDDIQSYPRLPFEPINREVYEELMKGVKSRQKTTDFHAALLAKDAEAGDRTDENQGPAACDSDKCLIPDLPKG